MLWRERDGSGKGQKDGEERKNMFWRKDGEGYGGRSEGTGRDKRIGKRDNMFWRKDGVGFGGEGEGTASVEEGQSPFVGLHPFPSKSVILAKVFSTFSLFALWVS